MMNKKKGTIAAVIVGVLVIGGGALAYTNNQDSKPADDAAMVKKQEAATMEKATMAENEPAMNMSEAAMSAHGSYVTLADFDKDPGKYEDTKKVYFFHASWCPICQSIDKGINADITTLPAGTTFIKTDFDSQKDLRKKYGVTIQHTFVQVDNNGNQITKWSATSLSDAVAGISN